MDKAGMEPTPEGRTGEAIRGAAEGAKDELSRLGEEVKEKSASIFHNQRDVASRQIHSLAHALEAGAESLDEEGQARLAEYTRDAADRVHRLGDEFMERDLGRMVDNVNRYARENPAVIIGGAAAFGFLLSRFLKSSSSRSHESDLETRGTEPSDVRTSTPTTTATDIGYSANVSGAPGSTIDGYDAAAGSSVGSSVGEQGIGDTRSEGMAPGISPIGESARVEDTRRRFGDGTES